MQVRADEQTWRRAQEGDRRALEALVAALLPRARNLVRYLVRGDADVDDMAQKGMMAVVQGLSSFRGDAPVERWADRIVAREALRHVRRRRQIDAQIHQAAPDLRLLSSEPEPADAYPRRRHLARCLDRLPDLQRQALVLHHVLGYSVPEIARTLDVPANTVKSRLRLGAQRLRTLLDGDSPSRAGAESAGEGPG